MKLQPKEIERIRKWIYRNARPLDLALWKYHIEYRSNDDVEVALAAYQNLDGGFGHALEADAWNPASTPIQTSTAIEKIESIGGLDRNHPMIQEILTYLASGKDFQGNRWENVVKENDGFPHAPWWHSATDAAERREFNPTPILTGFILKYADKKSPLYALGLSLAKELVLLHRSRETMEMHPLLNLVFLYTIVEEIGLDNEDWFKGAKQKLIQDELNLIQRDLASWDGYACLPTTFIQSPRHPLYERLKDVVEGDLKRKITGRNADGIWNLTWNWGAYPEAFAISENWWKAEIAIRNLVLLRAFDFMDE
ncbi:MAG: hypothetical protein A2Y20_00300 [Firmicutes bacterium GWF2_51_9]|nr:MAG: hypothetical protein A2Y20_00300 [Firmicutes bacterium GWF2_51_9]OGS59018.1 MAG: hypothetical protein A2Y19_04445 [Firmicutes bacterium GWE2_51_13]HAM62866.1 hypothetical protein [Erysipelotrichaceae bacterium]HAO62107.1 hypothetical protein [Erysipelotrichaceae bacterium]HBZ40659.1 hypothetical protein [Erysipelotrichaceae bacterium]